MTGLDGHDDSDLAVAMAIAEGSAHPLAVSLTDAIRRKGVRPTLLDALNEVPGYGVESRWQGQTVRLGRADWLGAESLATTATYLRIGDKPAQAFEFADVLREGAAEVVAALKAQGKDIVLLSGDTSLAGADIAGRVGIEAWEAQMLPADKAARIAVLAKAGRRVLMVGDGLNDTAALASAHVSISPASALDAARVVSDMVLLGGSLAPIADAMRISGSATRRIKENFAIAALYNLVAIPVALAGFATPLAAALAMSGSSISVSLNALRLTRR